VQSLERLGERGKSLLSAIVQTLIAREHSLSLVPVVFETSDSQWADYLVGLSVRRSREAFQGYRIGEACRKALVNLT
jgi:hypothetical protein